MFKNKKLPNSREDVQTANALARAYVPLPMLSMAAVRQAKILIPPFKRSRVAEPTFNGALQFFPELHKLGVTVDMPGAVAQTSIPMVFDDRGKNITPYLLCDVCDRKTTMLVFDEVFKCSQDFIRFGTGSSQRARRERVRIARDQLDAVERPRLKPIDKSGLSPYLDAAQSYGRLNIIQPNEPRIPEGRADNYSTERAMILGRGAGDYDVVRDYVAGFADSPIPLQNARGSISRPDNSAPIENTPVLDLNVLARLGCLSDKQIVAFTLKWPDNEILFLVDPHHGPVPKLLISYEWWNRDNPGWQPIAIVRQDNGRRRFVCPAEGQVCDKLYLRDGYFASKEAHRLFNASQRGEHRPRSAKRERERQGAQREALERSEKQTDIFRASVKAWAKGANQLPRR